MKNKYNKKQIWKTLIIISGIIICALSLLSTNSLVKEVKDEENKKMELWAESYKELIKSVSVNPIAMKIAMQDSTIPIIWTKHPIIHEEGVKAFTKRIRR